MNQVGLTSSPSELPLSSFSAHVNSKMDEACAGYPMVDRHMHSLFARLVFVLCFALLAITCLVSTVWLLFSMLTWSWPMPLISVLIYAVFAAQVLSVVLYFKYPLISIIVAWTDIVMIVFGVFPWRGHSVQAFFHQFGLNVAFFGFAHLGFIASHYREPANRQSAPNAGTQRTFK